MKTALIALIASASLTFAAEIEYTIKPLSVITSTGVIGIPVGTKVVKGKDGKYEFSGFKIDISRYALTTDINLVNRAIQLDVARQQALVDAARKAAEEAIKAAPVATPAPTPVVRQEPRRVNPLDLPARDR